MPYPHSINENKLFSFIWNSPKHAFRIMLFLVVVTQSVWLIFISSEQNDWSLFIIILLQVSAYISLVRSREKIRLLLNQISNISKISISARRWRILKISMLVYCVIMFIMCMVNQIGYFCTKAREYVHNEIISLSSFPEELMEHLIFIIDIFLVSIVIMTFGITGTFIGYYSFACICIKSCFTKFILKSETLISEGDSRSILRIHEEISEVMALANEFLPYPAFINVLCNMGALFAFSYCVAFYPLVDIETYFILIYGIFQNVMALLLLMISAARCNRSLNLAMETIKSLPGWLPQHRKVLKMHIRQRHSKTFPLTLWNIYVINESLLINAFGTLLTYGFLVGNIKND
ncbi:uncharacterized protein NPIL_538351 [Nephila pilipes]|uniref:Uncharacterized protein n=1 Tax=Nephila pilipes TaxID=299642 RepID=A0A8X6TU00_NEPPI|nr:uncharacterized protein NPIL_538351 [Nephila pilipes]